MLGVQDVSHYSFIQSTHAHASTYTHSLAFSFSLAFSRVLSLCLSLSNSQHVMQRVASDSSGDLDGYSTVHLVRAHREVDRALSLLRLPMKRLPRHLAQRLPAKPRETPCHCPAVRSAPTVPLAARATAAGHVAQLPAAGLRFARILATTLRLVLVLVRVPGSGCVLPWCVLQWV